MLGSHLLNIFMYTYAAAITEQPKRMGYSYEDKVYERRDAKSSKVVSQIHHLSFIFVVHITCTMLVEIFLYFLATIELQHGL